VRKFLKQRGGVDLYTGVTVSWIRGFDPTLYVYNEQGAAVKTTRLAQYDFNQLHQLFSAHFSKRSSARSLHATENEILKNEAPGTNPPAGQPIAESTGSLRNAPTFSRRILLMSIGALAVFLVFAAASRLHRSHLATSKQMPHGSSASWEASV